MAKQATFHTQPHVLLDRVDGDNYFVHWIEEPVHVMRSLYGRRTKPKFTRRLNRRARAMGFINHRAYIGHLVSIMGIGSVNKPEVNDAV